MNDTEEGTKMSSKDVLESAFDEDWAKAKKLASEVMALTDSNYPHYVLQLLVTIRQSKGL